MVYYGSKKETRLKTANKLKRARYINGITREELRIIIAVLKSHKKF